MKTYRIQAGAGVATLNRFDAPTGALGASAVRVRIRAVSLNYRDLVVARGDSPVPSDHPLIPCSDGAGEVIEVGAKVTRLRAGDRVATTFFPAWIDGEPSVANTAGTLGAAADGTLAEEIIAEEAGLVSIPSHLNFPESATLPCAGVTAWNALFVAGKLKPGNTVLLLGTGGVSIWALQLARAAGLFTIITSSSDAKLERARALGANETINYRAVPQWQEEVVRLTHGRGVDLVVEVGGHGTLQRSVAATRIGGTIALVGGVSGFSTELAIAPLLVGAKNMTGIYVGSRAMFEDLNRFVAAARIQPVVDRVFDFDDARGAYAYLEAANHFGKVVINVAA
jgi:NADPH:quinone reductase-like Zn-dependent oxidoreductase